MPTKPLRVLQVIGAMDRGGAETLVMNLYRHIDREKVQFDFLVNETRECDYDAEIDSLGGIIYRVPRFRLFNYHSYVKECNAFFSTRHYPIVHGHIGFPSAIYLSIAKKAGSYTIAHSHAQNYPLSPQEIVFRAVSNPARNIADYFMACSRQAGLDRYGKSVVNGSNFHILNNGLDVELGRYSASARDEVRSELGISSNAPVFGHVGRLTSVKNHVFLLKVFKEIKALLPSAQLLLLGRGELEEKLKSETSEMGLNDSVHFLGIRTDVPRFLSAMDVFVFTSFREGLSNAVIEAQASGLPCIVSTGVPELAKIRPQTTFLDLRLGARSWAETVVEAFESQDFESRATAYLDARAAGFDIQESATWLQDFYLRAAEFNPSSI